jgi:hypothetical protein
LVARDAIKPAEILVVKIGVLPAVVTGGRCRIEDGPFQGIEPLDLVGSVLVAPHTIGVLSVIMVVLTWIHNQCNFGLPSGAGGIEIALLDAWNIGFL